MWVYRTGADSPHPIVLFDYQSGRGQVYPKAFLDGYAGYLQVDGYQAYNNLCDVIPVGCWAHACRKFDEALKFLPKEKQRSGGKAMQALSTIQKLYRVETQAKGLSANTISRLKGQWQEEHGQWRRRDLTGKRYVYWWADGVHSNVRMTD